MFGSVEAAVLGVPAIDMVAQVQSLPGKDELAVALSFAHYPGGAAANVAVGTCRLGHRSALLGALGDDDAGRILLETLRAEGVETTRLRIHKAHRTPTCFIAVGPHGERMIFALGGVTLAGELEADDQALLSQTKALYITDANMEVAAQAARWARAQGSTVFLNPGGLLSSGGFEALKPLLGLADAVIIGHAEGVALLGKDEPRRMARKLLACGPQHVLVTLGIRGVLLAHSDGQVVVEAFRAPKVTDTTGAGDAFAAGLIAGFLEGLQWEDCARLGCAVAALKIGQLGAQSGLPTRQQAQDFMSHSQGGAP